MKTPTHFLSCSLSSRAYHHPQVWNAVAGNPKGIVPSSPGLRACELPWEVVRTAAQPRRGCGSARHPWTQPRRGWLLLTRSAQGSSFLATLGFAAESLRDSRNFSREMWVMISLGGRAVRGSALFLTHFRGWMLAKLR